MSDTFEVTVSPASGVAPLSTTYNVNVPTTIYNFVLDYDDGTSYTASPITSGFATSHTYNTPGIYTGKIEGDKTSSYSAWLYYKTHSITSNTNITNYQVILNIYYGSGTDSGNNVYLNSHCNTDFSDLRFVDSNENILPYWIESKTDSSSAIVFVKMILINPISSITIYYGNNAATSESSGDNTFDFFDDFTGSSLDTTKWTDGGNTPIRVIANSVMQVTFPDITPNITNTITAKTAIDSGDLITCCKYRVVQGFDMQWEWGKYCHYAFVGYHWTYFGSNISTCLGNTWYSPYPVPYSSRPKMFYIPKSIYLFQDGEKWVDNGTWMRVEFHRHGTGDVIYTREDFLNAWTIITFGSWLSERNIGSPGSNHFVISTIAYAPIAQSYIPFVAEYDYVFQHKYAEIEPTHGSWSSEIAVGTYTHLTYTSPYSITVNTTITPSISGLDINVTLNDPNSVSNVLWNWGDGNTTNSGASKSSSHTYVISGDGSINATASGSTINVTLTGASASSTFSILATYLNSESEALSAATTVTVSDPSISNINWTWGDATSTNTGSTVTSSHTYGPSANNGSITAHIERLVSTYYLNGGTDTYNIGVSYLDGSLVSHSASKAVSISDSNLNNIMWNFGDNNYSDTDDILYTTHTYATAGTYYVVANYKNSSATSLTASREFRITDSAPASILSNSTGLTLSVSLIYSVSISSITWGWGDGSTTTLTDGGKASSHTYASNGTYTITATYTDINLAYNSLTTTVTVNENVTPVTSTIDVARRGLKVTTTLNVV